jgi:uridine phosphorylase
LQKQRGTPVFKPADFRRYLASRRGVPESELSAPEDLLFTYDREMFRLAIEKTAAHPVDWYIYRDRMYRGAVGGRPLGIVHAMVGAPAACMNLEELTAYGAKRVYELGLAGAIDRGLEPGDVVLLSGALSDEGASKHYYKGCSRFDSSPVLTRRLGSFLRAGGIEHVVGDAWTVDAPYRETKEKVRSFRRKGARVVNMESSAVFAIARYRGTEAASVQIVSDIVSDKEWAPAFHEEIVDRRRGEVLDAVLKAV